MFAKGIDIAPAIVAGQIDIAASAVDAAIAARAQNIPIYVIAGFAKGGARIVIGNNSSIKSVADFKGKKWGLPVVVLRNFFFWQSWINMG